MADAALGKSSTLGVIVLRGAGSKFSNLEDVLDTFPELRRVSVRCVLGDVRKEKTFSTPVNSLADLPGLRKKYRDVLQKHGVRTAVFMIQGWVVRDISKILDALFSAGWLGRDTG